MVSDNGTGIIVVVVYAGRARKVRSILQGENMLAHWKYQPDEWSNFAEKEYTTEKKGKWRTFYVIAGLALLTGILFFIINRESGGWVLVSMLALIGIIAFTVWFTSW